MLLAIAIERLGIVTSLANSLCKAYKHPRRLKMKNCETMWIKDKMCKGFCVSVTYPQVVDFNSGNGKNSRNNQHILESRPSPMYNQLSFVKSKCSMCIPIKFKTRQFTLTCRRRNKRSIKDIRSLLKPLWSMHKKNVTVDLLKACRCRRRLCNELPK